MGRTKLRDGQTSAVTGWEGGEEQMRKLVLVFTVLI